MGSRGPLADVAMLCMCVAADAHNCVWSHVRAAGACPFCMLQCAVVAGSPSYGTGDKCALCCVSVGSRIPSSVESVVASSLPHLAASSLTPANQGTSDHRHFKRHLRVMDIDEINPEIHANARPEELDQPGSADASQSTSSPSKAGAQRPRNEDSSPADAPPKAYSRL